MRSPSTGAMSKLLRSSAAALAALVVLALSACSTSADGASLEDQQNTAMAAAEHFYNWDEYSNQPSLGEPVSATAAKVMGDCAVVKMDDPEWAPNYSIVVLRQSGGEWEMIDIRDDDFTYPRDPDDARCGFKRSGAAD